MRPLPHEVRRPLPQVGEKQECILKIFSLLERARRPLPVPKGREREERKIKTLARLLVVGCSNWKASSLLDVMLEQQQQNLNPLPLL